jgi:protein transport protein SEC24
MNPIPNQLLNANWNPGLNTSYVATPPRSASGMATPVNSSTPNLVPTSASMSQITAGIQGMNVNKPLNNAPQQPPMTTPQFHQVASTPNLHYAMPTQTPYNSLAGSTQQLDNGNNNMRMPSQPPQINGNHPPFGGQQLPPTMPPSNRPVRPMYPVAQPAMPQQQMQYQQPNTMAFNTQPMMQQQQQQQQQQQYVDNQSYNNVVKQGFSRIWGNNTVDLLQNRNILPTEKVKPPTIRLNNPFQESINCSPE